MEHILVVANGGWFAPVVAKGEFLDAPSSIYRSILSSCSNCWKILTIGASYLTTGHCALWSDVPKYFLSQNDLSNLKRRIFPLRLSVCAIFYVSYIMHSCWQQKSCLFFITKNGLILPTGQWYAPSAVINTAWYCMVLHGIAWYCMVLQSFAWYWLILHGIAWYCMVLHWIAWYCMVLHDIAQ